MQSLIARNQFVGKGETGEKTALLQPVDGTKSPAEKDALDTRKCDEAGRKRVRAINPLERPLALLLDAGDRINCAEVGHLLVLILHILVDEKGIGLGVHALHRVLEGVEETGDGAVNFALEPSCQILLHDPVGAGEEGKDLLDECLLVGGEHSPVRLILAEINFLGGPKRGNGLFVHLVQLGLGRLDGKKSVPLARGGHSVCIYGAESS